MNRLEEIKARAEAATPGPWEFDRTNCGRSYNQQYGLRMENLFSDDPKYMLSVCVDVGMEDDAKFIASARDDIPWLIDEIERMEERLATQKEIIEGYVVSERKLYAEIARLREAVENARLEMIKFGNVAEWPPEMSMSYAEAINRLKEALNEGDA